MVKGFNIFSWFKCSHATVRILVLYPIFVFIGFLER